MTAFRVSPPFTRSAALVPETVRSLLSVTPLLNVPDVLLVASSSEAPSAKATVPPSIVPDVPEKFQDPVAAFRVSVVPVFFSVPVRFTTPPARLIVPIPAVPKDPARFTVLAALASRWSVPALLHDVDNDRMPPPIASIVPALLNEPLGTT